MTRPDLDPLRSHYQTVLCPSHLNQNKTTLKLASLDLFLSKKSKVASAQVHYHVRPQLQNICQIFYKSRAAKQMRDDKGTNIEFYQKATLNMFSHFFRHIIRKKNICHFISTV